MEEANVEQPSPPEGVVEGSPVPVDVPTEAKESRARRRQPKEQDERGIEEAVNAIQSVLSRLDEVDRKASILVESVFVLSKVVEELRKTKDTKGLV